MPIKGAKYRVKKTKKGNVRLAWVSGKVVEAKNLKTGDTATIKPKRRKPSKGTRKSRGKK